jgi:hypothetical protein
MNKFNNNYLKGIIFYEYRILRYLHYKINKHDFVRNDELQYDNGGLIGTCTVAFVTHLAALYLHFPARTVIKHESIQNEQV